MRYDGCELNVCVAGGRFFADKKMAYAYLNVWLKVCKSFGIDMVIYEGGALGADRIGRDFGEDNNLLVVTYEADWKTYKRAAGMVRNSVMMKTAHCLVAFWNGESSGTKHTISLGEKKKIPYMVVRYEDGVKPTLYDTEGIGWTCFFEEQLTEILRGYLPTLFGKSETVDS